MDDEVALMQVVEITGVSRVDAATYLSRCDGDVHRAVEMFFSGDEPEAEIAAPTPQISLEPLTQFSFPEPASSLPHFSLSHTSALGDATSTTFHLPAANAEQEAPRAPKCAVDLDTPEAVEVDERLWHVWKDRIGQERVVQQLDDEDQSGPFAPFPEQDKQKLTPLERLKNINAKPHVEPTFSSLHFGKKLSKFLCPESFFEPHASHQSAPIFMGVNGGDGDDGGRLGFNFGFDQEEEKKEDDFAFLSPSFSSGPPASSLSSSLAPPPSRSPSSSFNSSMFHSHNNDNEHPHHRSSSSTSRLLGVDSSNAFVPDLSVLGGSGRDAAFHSQTPGGGGGADDDHLRIAVQESFMCDFFTQLERVSCDADLQRLEERVRQQDLDQEHAQMCIESVKERGRVLVGGCG